MASGHTLGDLARRLGGRVIGDPNLDVVGVAPLKSAGPRQLSFLANPRYLQQARATRAAAVMVGPGVELAGVTTLVVPDPYLALADVLEIFHPSAPPEPGVSPRAMVAEEVVLGTGVSVMQGAAIGARTHVGERSIVMSGAVLGSDVSVGADTTVHPNVVVYDGCVIGSRVILHGGAVIGSDGFGFARDGKRHRKIPQVGNVVIEDDVEIGANVAIDRATLGSTVIGRGTKIDNLVQIGHNVQIGAHSLLVAQVGISGSARLGEGVTFAGQSGAVGHIEIGDGVIVGAKSAVTHDIPAGAFVVGYPAIEAGLWRRAMAVFARLPELRRRLMRLEAASSRGEKEA